MRGSSRSAHVSLAQLLVTIITAGPKRPNDCMRECYGSGFTSKLPVQHDETVAAKEQQLDSQSHSGADWAVR
jgi:hypothetical protein